VKFAAVVRALVEAGATPQMILAAVEAHEASNDHTLAKRRANDAKRQQKHREKASGHVMSRDVTVTENEQKVSPEPLSKNTLPSPPLGGAHGFPNQHFEAFWSAYPRRIGKRAAQQAFTAALKRAEPAAIMAGLARCAPAWTEPAFTPHPTTWLNRDGWLDELRPASGHDPPQPVTPELTALRLQQFQTTGQWREAWGPRPEERAA